MDVAFNRFIEELRSAPTLDMAGTAMQSQVEALDFCGFAYAALPRDGPPLYLSTYAAWFQRYLQARYYEVDPRKFRVMHTVLPFAWGTSQSSKDLSKRQQQLFSESREYGFTFGITVPIHGVNGRVAALNYSSRQSEPAFLSSLERHQHRLHLMALHFHALKGRLLTLDMETVRLSPRELECLQWVAHGKTRWQVARIMEITERTVGFHLDNAKRKLGVSSTTQAVVKGMSLRLLAS